MTDTKKKIRSENWLEEDKQLLQELIKERVHIIENKNTDTDTNQQKKTCWNGLLDSFNSLCTGKMRSVAQLKTQWSTIKFIEKRKIASERRELIKTDDGPQEPITITCHNNIKAWLPNEFVADVNEFDSDIINRNNIVEENNFLSTNKRKKREISTTTDITTKEISAISSAQVECRKSLHAIQMEVENLRKENEIKKKHILELEEENAIKKKHILQVKGRAMEVKEKAIQAKYQYYKNKMALLDSTQNK